MSRKFDIKSLDFSNIGSWPREAKAVFCAIIGALIVLLFWFLFISDKRDELTGLEHTESDLRQTYEKKQGEAANLGALKQQLVQMEAQLQQMLRQLPSKNEMPDLIVDISQTALATGITNELFQPGEEQPKDFYAEKPIALRMVGTYHQFGAFMSGVASLPRVVIMTMHDISLKPKNAPAANGVGANDGLLELSGTVKTYRYLDEEEVAKQATPANGQAPASGQPANGAKGG
ncbi:type 4a pilus biogenesis protein PilO [Lysobacter sp. HA35]